MRKFFILLISAFFILPFSRADEGMWLPFLLKLNEKDMQSKGLKISAEDIYSINQGSLKDAIVLFGGGCTGEIVSEQGLLLTNHHCGYGRIQTHSSLENDYLTNGFWAMKKEEELSNPGFIVTMLVSMKDVTNDVLKYVSDQMDEVARNKKILETEFKQWVSQDATRKQNYGNILSIYEQLYKQLTPLSKENSYFMEAFYSIEMVRFVWQFISFLDKVSIDNTIDVKQTAKAYVDRVNSFFKDFNKDVDKEIFVLLMQAYYDNADKFNFPIETEKLLKKYSIQVLANEIYSKSIFTQQEKLEKILEEGNHKSIVALKNDILCQLVKPLQDYYFDAISPKMSELNMQIKQLDRMWTKALMEMQTNKTFYPDANLTLRVAYGKIDGYDPMDGVSYKYFTTVEGIMEKENPDIYDYVVEPKLKQLYDNKDYGCYAMKNGQMPVAFVATNHTTGGNSGSPILNGDGHLIGINFDRCWEGTMSDIQYDPDQCRNISVDIRYVLFIMDKFAGAKHLVDEMTIVQ